MTNLFDVTVSVNDLSKSVKFPTKVVQLNDDYVQITGGGQPDITWNITSGWYSYADLDTRLTLLNQYGGYTELRIDLADLGIIQGRTSDYEKVYTAWEYGQLRLTLEQSTVIDCPQLQIDLTNQTADILNKLNGAFGFIQTYTTDNMFMFLNADKKLPPNAMHSVLGQGGYFPAVCGTTEGIFLIILSLLDYYELTNTTAALTLAQSIYNGAVDVVYKGNSPPNPADSAVWLPHWLYAAKTSTITKGTATEPNFLNGGEFTSSPVAFTNRGSNVWTATLSSDLSDVYKVYSSDGQLLWKYVLSPLIAGVEYTLLYWIDRNNQKCSKQDGRTVQATNNTAYSPGTVAITVSGLSSISANIVYAVYKPSVVVNKNECIEAFPFWRRTLTNEYNHAMDVSNWAYQAYLRLYQFTQNTLYSRAADATKYSTLQSLDIQNTSFVFKVDTETGEPFSIAGTQLIKINGKTGSASRNTGAPIDGGLKITHDSSVPTTYGQLEAQNFVVSAVWIRATTLNVNYWSSVGVIIYWGVSIANDASDFSQIYIAPQWCPANTLQTKSLKSSEFYKFTSKTIWYPTVADVPIYTYTSGGNVDFQYINDAIPNSIGSFDNTLTLKVSASKGSYAGFGLNNLQNLSLTRKPPMLYYKLESGSVQYTITDASDNKFSIALSQGSAWNYTAFNWSDFTGLTTSAYNDQASIKNIEFNVQSASAVLYLFVVGDTPDKLPVPCYTYKTVVTNKNANAQTWIVGNCEIKNSSLNILPYTPGVVPFTYNRTGNARYSWVGEAMTGYQSARLMQLFGLPAYERQVELFWLAAQDSYTQASPSGEIGLARQSYNWARWDAIARPPYNKFIDSGTDPNQRWEGYQHRYIADAAEAWYNDQTNNFLSTVVMRFLRWIDKYWNLYGDPGKVPTDYVPPQNGLPLRNYTSPHGTALVMSAACNANMAGGDKLVTYRTLIRCLTFLNGQYVSTGVMAGSWTKDQPDFTNNGVTYKENFPFWHSEIIRAYALVQRHKNDIRLPSCSDWGL